MQITPVNNNYYNHSNHSTSFKRLNINDIQPACEQVVQEAGGNVNLFKQLMVGVRETVSGLGGDKKYHLHIGIKPDKLGNPSWRIVNILVGNLTGTDYRYTDDFIFRGAGDESNFATKIEAALFQAFDPKSEAAVQNRTYLASLKDNPNS